MGDPGRRDQIEDIARRLDGLLRAMADVKPARAGETPVAASALAAARRALRNLCERQRTFDGTISGDPAWNILLDLFIAHEEGRNVSIPSICEASNVAEGVILRCIAHLVEAGLVARQPHAADPNSIYLVLTAEARRRMCDYFTRTEGAGGRDE
jgi:hypothetical protein